MCTYLRLTFKVGLLEAFGGKDLNYAASSSDLDDLNDLNDLSYLNIGSRALSAQKSQVLPGDANFLRADLNVNEFVSLSPEVKFE